MITWSSLFTITNLICDKFGKSTLGSNQIPGSPRAQGACRRAALRITHGGRAQFLERSFEPNGWLWPKSTATRHHYVSTESCILNYFTHDVPEAAYRPDRSMHNSLCTQVCPWCWFPWVPSYQCATLSSSECMSSLCRKFMLGCGSAFEWLEVDRVPCNERSRNQLNKHVMITCYSKSVSTSFPCKFSAICKPTVIGFLL